MLGRVILYYSLSALTAAFHLTKPPREKYLKNYFTRRECDNVDKDIVATAESFEISENPLCSEIACICLAYSNHFHKNISLQLLSKQTISLHNYLSLETKLNQQWITNKTSDTHTHTEDTPAMCVNHTNSVNVTFPSLERLLPSKYTQARGHHISFPVGWWWETFKGLMFTPTYATFMLLKFATISPPHTKTNSFSKKSNHKHHWSSI